MKTFIRTTLYAGLLFGAMQFAHTSYAQTSDSEAGMRLNGQYAGSFLCSLGEMGMVLEIKDAGAIATLRHLGEMPCKTGAGQCNDVQDALLARTRHLNGVLNFYPTVGNPDAPAGAFNVSGTAELKGKYVTLIELEPEDWVEKPDNFEASGMIGTLVNSKISGQPTAQGCHTLRLKKLAQ